jgi:hypothetical protein
MTIKQTKDFEKGRDYWYQYLKINGYSFSPNEKGITALSKNLDLNKKHLRSCINTFLSA